MMNTDQWNEIKHFKPSEFTCKCGCGLNNIDSRVVKVLDYIRGYVGRPIFVTSGCRCEKHNKAVKGEHYSSHLKGLAVDITVKDNKLRALVLEAFYHDGIRSYLEDENGFFNIPYRIGIGENFIHIDVDESKTHQVCWLY